MGIEGLVASSAEQYVAMAVRLGTDAAYRQTMASLIDERSPVLFEELFAVREYEEFFLEAIETGRAR
jgi:predicted O-linked N-acetylglucosamine transferase (SPINDLY family)